MKKENLGESVAEEKKEKDKEIADTMRPRKKRSEYVAKGEKTKGVGVPGNKHPGEKTSKFRVGKEIGAKHPSKSNRTANGLNQKPLKGHAPSSNSATAYRKTAAKINAKGVPKVNMMPRSKALRSGLSAYEKMRHHK